MSTSESFVRTLLGSSSSTPPSNQFPPLPHLTHLPRRYRMPFFHPPLDRLTNTARSSRFAPLLRLKAHSSLHARGGVSELCSTVAGKYFKHTHLGPLVQVGQQLAQLAEAPMNQENSHWDRSRCKLPPHFLAPSLSYLVIAFSTIP